MIVFGLVFSAAIWIAHHIQHPITIDIDTARLVKAEHDRLQELLTANDIEGLIARYPVRETPALAGIAEELGFQDREQYEGAVLKLLIDEADALAFVRGLFSDLSTQIAT